MPRGRRCVERGGIKASSIASSSSSFSSSSGVGKDRSTLVVVVVVVVAMTVAPATDSRGGVSRTLSTLTGTVEGGGEGGKGDSARDIGPIINEAA